jgi:hypothetical protein
LFTQHPHKPHQNTAATEHALSRYRRNTRTPRFNIEEERIKGDPVRYALAGFRSGRGFSVRKVSAENSQFSEMHMIDGIKPDSARELSEQNGFPFDPELAHRRQQRRCVTPRKQRSRKAFLPATGGQCRKDEHEPTGPKQTLPSQSGKLHSYLCRHRQSCVLGQPVGFCTGVFAFTGAIRRGPCARASQVANGPRHAPCFVWHMSQLGVASRQRRTAAATTTALPEHGCHTI